MTRHNARQFRTIETLEDLAVGVRSLRRRCPLMRQAYRIAGDPPLRRTIDGFEGLARIVVGQQVSTASAAAIWGRLTTLLSPMDPHAFLGSSDDELRGVGLSRAKIRTLMAIAEAAENGAIDFANLTGLPDATVHTRLIALHGIGPWTADIYLMFCLGRPDAFAAGDLALQVAAARLAHSAGTPGVGHVERFQPAALVDFSERWRPWRAVAARLLWAYYREMKSGNSGTPV